jgi:hypothetical protein
MSGGNFFVAAKLVSGSLARLHPSRVQCQTPFWYGIC